MSHSRTHTHTSTPTPPHTPTHTQACGLCESRSAERSHAPPVPYPVCSRCSVVQLLLLLIIYQPSIFGCCYTFITPDTVLVEGSCSHSCHHHADPKTLRLWHQHLVPLRYLPLVLRFCTSHGAIKLILQILWITMELSTVRVSIWKEKVFSDLPAPSSLLNLLWRRCTPTPCCSVAW